MPRAPFFAILAAGLLLALTAVVLTVNIGDNVAYTTGHHIGKPPTSFKNPWPSYKNDGIITALRARFNTPKNFVPVPADRLGLVQVRKPDFNNTTNGLKATWIGHASFLIETTASEGNERGMRILLDPVWSDRVGPYGMVT